MKSPEFQIPFCLTEYCFTLCWAFFHEGFILIICKKFLYLCFLWNPVFVSLYHSSEQKGQEQKITQELLQNEVGIFFCHVLEDAGIYKRTPKGQAAFQRFIDVIIEGK